MQWLAIGIGAAFGACLRAWLSRFNGHLLNVPALSWLPLGTLLANVLGGLLIGAAIVLFEHFASSVHPHAKAMVVTGFLGGLTTFSTFSAEVFTHINDGRMLAGIMLAGSHLCLTLCATVLGFYMMKGLL